RATRQSAPRPWWQFRDAATAAAQVVRMAVRKSIEIPRAALRRLFFQRCFYLFIVLLALIGVSPFMEGVRGSYLLSGFNAFVVLAAAAALGRTALSSVIVLLLRYVFGPEVLDADRMWGAGAAYVMIGILWCFIYALIELEPGQTFLVRGDPAKLQLTELLYFSFSTLTTIGFGDIVPVSRGAQ